MLNSNKIHWVQVLFITGMRWQQSSSRNSSQPKRKKQLRREIRTFQQKDGEHFFKAWEHFNKLILKCLCHNLSQDEQDGLNAPNKTLVNSTCGGMLMEKSSEEAIELFETLSKNSQ
jgi:hypothetical protein